jgi:hypothetical protein
MRVLKLGGNMNTIVHGGKDLLRSTYKSLQTMIDRYCPNGQTCRDLSGFGGLLFTLWFMWLAMEPILVW